MDAQLSALANRVQDAYHRMLACDGDSRDQLVARLRWLRIRNRYLDARFNAR